MRPNDARPFGRSISRGSASSGRSGLSSRQAAEFRFRDGGMDLRIAVTRSEFEGGIAEELRSIERCIDGLLESSGVDARQVDRVFLTGGSSFVPAVRRIFATRFGKERIRSGNEFTSVAYGLALRGREAAAGRKEPARKTMLRPAV